MISVNLIAHRLRMGSLAGTVSSDPFVIDPLVISPSPNIAELEKSGSASIDLRLGSWFVSLRQARMSHLEIDDPDPNVQFTKTHYVRFGDSYYLHPRSFVLSSTLEWLRLPSDLAAYVIGRSSWGRRGLIIATATGVHPGFKGCLTLEITNVGEIPIAIKPGMSICQLFFHLVEGSKTEYVDRSQFAGSRKPSVGRIKPDEFFQSLTNDPRISWILGQFRSKIIPLIENGVLVEKILEDPLVHLDSKENDYIKSLTKNEIRNFMIQIESETIKVSNEHRNRLFFKHELENYSTEEWE